MILSLPKKKSRSDLSTKAELKAKRKCTHEAYQDLCHNDGIKFVRLYFCEFPEKLSFF